MFRRKGFWIGLIIALAAGGGYAYYSYVYLPSQTTVEQTIVTAQVHQGDLVISVSGSGTLNPASEIDLGFQSGGYLDEVLVDVAPDHVPVEWMSRLSEQNIVGIC